GMENPCVLLFLKAPEIGRVKTRLSKDLNPRTGIDLYRCFVSDILSTLEKTGLSIILCHDPPDDPKAIRRWLGNRHPLMPQHAGDLGERMADAFRNCFSRGFDRAVLIGTDIPDLPPAFLREAFSRLKEHPVVLGPAEDGGYYLIGFRSDSFIPEVFKEISWSTPSVLEQTRDILKTLGRSCYLLPIWKDIDTVVNLKALSKNPYSRRNAPNTLAYLSKMGLN
ncbi:MAG: TIGR04282 family arsenosugar biosynthesis glycosyltransferase, partial [Thermodesulfobacteriota bacterium]